MRSENFEIIPHMFLTTFRMDLFAVDLASIIDIALVKRLSMDDFALASQLAVQCSQEYDKDPWS